MIFNLGLLAAYTIVAFGLSVMADQRLKDRSRLPMQWGFDGRPTWSAPRRVALALTPLLGGIGFLLITSIRLVQPETTAEDETRLGELQLGLAGLGLAVQAGYLWLVGRWAEKNRPG